MTKTIRCRRRVWFDDHICRTITETITLQNCRQYGGTMAGYTADGERLIISAADVLEVIA